ncbi:MAG: TIGR00266 family protein [Oscillospiraceae bacterium]|nr:TIGR00266 family protein [Oscillospiraceae bacterium]
MNYQVKGEPFPVVVCSLDSGESVNCQKGAMAWMSPNMQMQTNAGGGVGRMISRAVSGESIFQNVYTAQGGAGEIAFAASVPGHIMAMNISASRSVVAQKRAYLASEMSVDMSMFFQKKIGAGFFGGEGFIMQKFTGNGTVFLEIDGSVVEYDLQANESIHVDTGYLAAMDATCSVDIVTVKGIGNALFGGEGFFNTVVSGPGHVWLQTMPASAIAGALAPFMASNKG